LKQPPKTVDLTKIDEEVIRLESASTQASDTPPVRELLEGFTQANVKLHFISGNLEKLYEKKKYRNLFDLGVLSVGSANQISKDLSVLFKD